MGRRKKRVQAPVMDAVQETESVVAETLTEEKEAAEAAVASEDAVVQSDDAKADMEHPETQESLTEQSDSSQKDMTEREDAKQESEQGSTEEAKEEPQEKAEKKAKKKLPKTLRALIHLIIKLIVIGIIGVLVWTYVGEIYIQHDNNMYPHIKDGALVVVYKLDECVKDDPVLYEANGERKLGRIVAVEGSNVYIDDTGMYTVDDYSPYENVFYSTRPSDGGVEYPYVVEEGKVFILNDMRDMPVDSRVFGAIEKTAIIGKVALMVQHRGI